MVTGASNFPVRKKEKQNHADHENMMEYREIQKILDVIKSTGRGGIRSDDPDAIKKLQEKLEMLENLQKKMKAVNLYYRKYKTLSGYPEISDKTIGILDSQIKNAIHKVPYPNFCLTNNNAEINRIEKRIEKSRKSI